MGKAKPFLFGGLLGAGTMFVALQYHVVRSHDGFQFIPRTPQHSVGLAYTDIREWNETQWLDRPELARALMAHGAGDLITESVAKNLAESVSTQGATLDQLKSFFEKSAEKTADSDLFRLPDLQPLRPADSSGTPADSPDLNATPYPREAGKPVAVDPFRMAQTQDPNPAVAGNPAVTGGSERVFAPPEFRRPATSTPPSNLGGKSTTQREADAIERVLFDAPASAATPQSAAPGAESRAAIPPVREAAPFEEIAADLESRARSALSRAQSTLGENAGDSTSDASKFQRSPFPSSASGVAAGGFAPSRSTTATPNAGATGSDPLRALRDRFDPFLE